MRSYERLVGALQSSDAGAHVMNEALRAMIEARFLLVTGHRADAMAVLDKGIGELRYALNLSDVEPA